MMKCEKVQKISKVFYLKGLGHDFRSKFSFSYFMYKMVYLLILND